ncbi:MAG: hypothetical protein AB1333_00535 [Patescibacteria group bacterium]
MRTYQRIVKEKAIELRKQGKTYIEIESLLKIHIPKSTFSFWFHGLEKNPIIAGILKKTKENSLKKARIAAQEKKKRIKNEKNVFFFEKNKNLFHLLDNKNIAKIVLTTLYLGEGSKNPNRGSIVFGNSDPKIISLFLELLRKNYVIDETKFRCTVQCRVGQDINTLENFWVGVTKIPRKQFYLARIDPRTRGIISKKPDYKGVCRIDYFSAEVLNDLLGSIKVITMGR